MFLLRLSLLKALARLFEGPFPPLIPMQPEECEEFRLLSFVERKEALILQMGEVWLQAWIDLLSMLDDRWRDGSHLPRDGSFPFLMEGSQSSLPFIFYRKIDGFRPVHAWLDITQVAIVYF